ncbi:MAG: MoaD/ThiS family protein [Rhizobiales bacterium]|nr:MoaD/ThiS family protein [Hyphomicrobiales bacterium]
MPTVTFTRNLQRHVDCPSMSVPGTSVREALENVFAANARIRSYVLDDQGALRRHMTIYIDGVLIRDRAGLGDPVEDASSIFVMQALSGG